MWILLSILMTTPAPTSPRGGLDLKLNLIAGHVSDLDAASSRDCLGRLPQMEAFPDYGPNANPDADYNSDPN